MKQHKDFNDDDEVYNVVAYVGHSRVMKELLTAKDKKEAIDIGKIVLRERGFRLKDARFEAILMD